jgi:TonB family protein
MSPHCVLCSLALTLAVAIALPAEDIQLRQRAVTLLEHADSISVPREFASYEQIIDFQSYTPAGDHNGRFTSVVQGPRSYRDEYQFGDYNLLVVVNGPMIADVGDRAKAPLEVRRMTILNRPYTGQFDQSDIIRSIQDAVVLGRAADCIEFDTVQGRKSEANEICIDKQFGILLRVHANGETITNSDFFPYRNTYLPAHITYEQPNLRMEMEQTKKETTGPFDPDFLTPPANALVSHLCKTFRRPFGQSMPQPKAGNGKQVENVMLHGTIRTDGRIRDIAIDHSDRENLNQEAVKVFSTWSFSPSVCDGAAIEVPADITLHFQGR